MRLEAAHLLRAQRRLRSWLTTFSVIAIYNRLDLTRC